MKKTKLFSISAALVLSLSVFLSASLVPASAKTTSQLQSELSNLESKSKAIESKINNLKKQKNAKVQLKNALQEKISATQSEINACVSIINGYKSEISECQAKINKKQKEIENTKFLYKKRMRSIAMTGSTNNDLLVLLDSDSFSDYLSLSEVSEKISAHDKKMLNEITAALSEIKAQKTEIDSKLAAQNSVKSKLATKQASLKSQRSEINGIISNINNDSEELKKENAAYEKAINDLESQIQAALNKANGGASAPKFVSGKFVWPCPGYYNISSPFGTRWGRLHGGIDISSSGISGKSIVAAAAGTVISAGYNSGGYGYWVMINHGKASDGNTYATVYGHMISSPSVSTGQSVSAGQRIGAVGSTGRSTGPHLHFEIRVNGNRVNPLNYYSKAK